MLRVKLQSTVRFCGQKAQDETLPLPVGLKPKTVLLDFYKSRTRHQPENNGVQKMDINPLVDEGDWFRIDDDYQAIISRKKALLEQYRDIITATLPEGEAGASELLEIMAEYLPKHFPEKFQREGRILTNRITQERYDLDNLPDKPIVIAGLLVQEDFVMLHQGEDDQFQLTAASLHFPSDWSLRDKLGKTLDEIHQPVPLVNQNLGAAISRFLSRLSPDKQFWRTNYLVSTSPGLSHFPDIPDMSTFRDNTQITPENVDRLYLRNEREVFTRLPKTGDVLFSLKTAITSFRQLPPIIAKLLADVTRALPTPFVNNYRKWSDLEKQHILNFLDKKS